MMISVRTRVNKLAAIEDKPKFPTKEFLREKFTIHYLFDLVDQVKRKDVPLSLLLIGTQVNLDVKEITRLWKEKVSLSNIFYGADPGKFSEKTIQQILTLLLSNVPDKSSVEKCVNILKGITTFNDIYYTVIDGIVLRVTRYNDLSSADFKIGNLPTDKDLEEFYKKKFPEDKSKGILNVYIGDKNWKPTQEELDLVEELVKQADNDGSVITIRPKSTNNSWVLFDNCVEVKTNQRINAITKEDFKIANGIGSIKNAVEFPTAYAYNGDEIRNLHFMLKDPNVCDENEVYHFNVIEWKDRLSGEWHQLRFDTIVFLMNDSGDTIRKIEG